MVQCLHAEKKHIGAACRRAIWEHRLGRAHLTGEHRIPNWGLSKPSSLTAMHSQRCCKQQHGLQGATHSASTMAAAQRPGGCGLSME